MKEAMNEEKCEVHGTFLKSEKVPVFYGTPFIDAELINARMNQFPNARRYVIGGCTVRSHSESEIEELICDDCRTAEDEWMKANRPEMFNRKPARFDL